MIDRKFPVNYVDSNSISGSSDSEDEAAPLFDNSNNKRAEQELAVLESYKKKKYRPTLDRANSKIISDVDYGRKI